MQEAQMLQQVELSDMAWEQRMQIRIQFVGDKEPNVYED